MAVPANVATAGLVFASGARLSAQAVAGPACRGLFAGRVRFVLLAADDRRAVPDGRTRRVSARPFALPAASARCGYSRLTVLPGPPGVGLPETSQRPARPRNRARAALPALRRVG